MSLAEVQPAKARARRARGTAQPQHTVEFERLYQDYASRLERFISKRVNDRGCVEDLVQETFLRAYRSLETIDPRRSVWPWLATIAKRLCIDNWRAGGPAADVPTVIDDLGNFVEVAVDGDPVEAFFEGERRRVLSQTLGGLNSRYRRVLVLNYLEGWRHEDIAALEGVTPQAMRTTLSRARESFRRCYEAVASEHGVPVVVGPLVAGIRGWGRRLGRASFWMRHLAARVPVDVVSSGAVEQVSNGLVALAILVGTIAPAAALTSASPGQTGGAAAPASAAVVSTSSGAAPSSEAARGSMETASGPADAGRTDGSHASPGANNDPTAPVTSAAPVKPADVTDPNRNVSQPEDSQSSSIVFSPSSDQTVFMSGRNKQCATQACPAVLYESTDAGSTWKRLGASGFDGDKILLPPAYGAGDNRIFAMTPSGVLQVSADGGATFGPAVTGAPQDGGPMTISPGFDGKDPRIVIGTQSSLVQYTDDTKTISPAPYSSLPGDLDPVFATASLLLVGGRQVDQNGVLGSTVFRCAHSVCDGTRLSDAPATPQLRVSPTFAIDGTVYAFTAGRIFVSTDGGRTFTAVPTPASTGSLYDLATGDGQHLYAGLRLSAVKSADGMYTSSDAGSSWQRVASPLFDTGVAALAVRGTRVLAGLGNGGVACSTDSGLTWAPRC